MRWLRTVRPLPWPSARLAAFGGLLLIALIPTIARSDEPAGATRRPVPARGLIAYLEYDGLDAHADAWKATSAHDMLVKTPAGAMLSEVARKAADYYLKELLGVELKGANILALKDLLLHKGFVIAASDIGDGNTTFTIVLKGLGSKKSLEQLDPLKRFLLDATGTTRIRGRDVYQISRWMSTWFEGRDLILVSDDDFGAGDKRPPWGHHKDHVAAVFDALEGKQPDVTTHPGFISALAEGQDLKGFEPTGLLFAGPGDGQGLLCWLIELGTEPPAQDSAPHAPIVDKAKVPASEIDRHPEVPDLLPIRKDELVFLTKAPEASRKPPTVNTTGPRPNARPSSKPEKTEKDPDDVFREIINRLDGTRRIVGRWGFQGRALVTDIRLEAPRPRKPFSALFEQPVFRKDHMPMIPSSANAFTIASFDPDATYQKFMELAIAFEPDCVEDFKELETFVREATGLRLREGLLRHLGPTWCIVELPAGSQHESNRKRPNLRNSVFLVNVCGPAGFEKVLDSLKPRVDLFLRSLEGGPRKKNRTGKEIAHESVGMERLTAPDRGYRVDFPAFFLDWLEADRVTLHSKPSRVLSLYLLMGKSSLVIADTQDRAREVLSAREPAARRWKPIGELNNAFEGLPENLTFLTVSNPRFCALPRWLAELPSTLQYLTNLNTLDEDFENKTCWILLDLMGIPRRGQMLWRIDPSRIPRAEDLRPYLFPSVLATTVDDRGYRIINREPIPLAGLASQVYAYFNWSIKWTGTGMPDVVQKFGLYFSSFGTTY